jgi:hypothetical protein
MACFTTARYRLQNHHTRHTRGKITRTNLLMLRKYYEGAGSTFCGLNAAPRVHEDNWLLCELRMYVKQATAALSRSRKCICIAYLPFELSLVATVTS